jgi:hypothetical protein
MQPLTYLAPSSATKQQTTVSSHHTADDLLAMTSNFDSALLDMASVAEGR